MGTADARHPQGVGAQHPGVDDDRVDPVEAAQSLRPQRQDRVSIGQSLSKRRGEGLRCGAIGRGGGHQDRGRGHVQVAGRGADQSGADRLDQRETTGVMFHRSAARAACAATTRRCAGDRRGGPAPARAGARLAPRHGIRRLSANASARPTDNDAGDCVAVSAAATASVITVSVAGRPMRFSSTRRSQGW